jgi:hypothetical protein
MLRRSTRNEPLAKSYLRAADACAYGRLRGRLAPGVSWMLTSNAEKPTSLAVASVPELTRSVGIELKCDGTGAPCRRSYSSLSSGGSHRRPVPALYAASYVSSAAANSAVR